MLFLLAQGRGSDRKRWLVRSSAVCWGAVVHFSTGGRGQQEIWKDAVDKWFEGHDAGADYRRVDLDAGPVGQVGVVVGEVGDGILFEEVDEADDGHDGDQESKCEDPVQDKLLSSMYSEGEDDGDGESEDEEVGGHV